MGIKGQTTLLAPQLIINVVRPLLCDLALYLQRINTLFTNAAKS